MPETKSNCLGAAANGSLEDSTGASIAGQGSKWRAKRPDDFFADVP